MKIETILILVLGCALADESSTTTGAPVVSTESAVSNSTSKIINALSQSSDNRVKLMEVQVLTFRAGRLATRMRTTPIEQLRCISGCVGELPTAVQCENKGWDGARVNWKCSANVKRGRILQNTNVRCEALPQGDREYILSGSCALEYSLGGSASSGRYPVNTKWSPSDSSSRGPFQYIVPLIMIAVVAVIFCAIVKACSKKESSGVVMGPPPGQYGGAPQGQFGGGYPTQPGFAPGYGQPGYGAAPMVAPVVSSGGGRSGLGAGVGGFAAGAATGGLLGYMLGNHGSSHHHYGGGGYGSYGQSGGDFNAGDMGGGGGYEMSTDFADTVME